MDLGNSTRTMMLGSRRRLVNFRVTEEEYDRMTAMCERRGSPSVSDFAREAIFRMFHSTDEREQVVARRLVDLEGRIVQLESVIEGLADRRKPVDSTQAAVAYSGRSAG